MIDIILATHNHLEQTAPCVSALYSFTPEFKLTVIDDSTDLTPQYFEQLNKELGNINFIHSDKLYTHGNEIINIGLKNTESPVVVYLGNSVRVEPDWLEVPNELMNREEDIGIIGIKLLYPTNTIEHAGIVWNPDMPHHMNIGVGEASHRYDKIYEVDMVGWALVFLRRAAFPKELDTETYIGFAGYDDIDNCLEVKKRGWRVFYCGMSVAYHFAGATRHDDPQLGEKYEQNRQTFLKKWGGTAQAQQASIIARIPSSVGRE